MKQGYVCSGCGDIEDDMFYTCLMCNQGYCKKCYDLNARMCHGCIGDMEEESE